MPRIRLASGNDTTFAGAGGLYRGLIPPLLTSGCISSVVFSSYEFMKLRVSSITGRPASHLNLQGTFAFAMRSCIVSYLYFLDYYASGFGCGVFVSIFTAPVHRVKILLQTSNTSASKLSSSAWGRSVAPLVDTFHCYKTAIADGGLRNLCTSPCIPSSKILPHSPPPPPLNLKTSFCFRYHGYSMQLAVESFGRGAYFSAYELCKQYFIKKNDGSLLPLHHRVVAGACAGLVGWYAHVRLTSRFISSNNRVFVSQDFHLPSRCFEVACTTAAFSAQSIATWGFERCSWHDRRGAGGQLAAS